MVDFPQHFVEIQHHLNKMHKPFDKSIITDLIEAAMSADYTAIRRASNVISRHLVFQNDQDGAKAIQSILRKRGVPLQASGYAQDINNMIRTIVLVQ